MGPPQCGVRVLRPRRDIAGRRKEMVIEMKVDEQELKAILAELDETAEICKALADRNRMRIIWVLASKTKEEVSVSDLAEFLEISQPAVTAHLKILKGIGLLYPQKVKNFVYYQIDLGRFRELKDRLDDLYGRSFRKDRGGNGLPAPGPQQR